MLRVGEAHKRVVSRYRWALGEGVKYAAHKFVTGWKVTCPDCEGGWMSNRRWEKLGGNPSNDPTKKEKK